MLGNITGPMLALVRMFENCDDINLLSLMVNITKDTMTAKTYVSNENSVGDIKCTFGTSVTSEPLLVHFKCWILFFDVIQNKCDIHPGGNNGDYNPSFTDGFLWGLIAAGWVIMSYCVLRDCMGKIKGFRNRKP